MDEPKITWRFTVKNGCVKRIGPQLEVNFRKMNMANHSSASLCRTQELRNGSKKTFAVATARASTAKAHTTKRATLSSSRQRW